MDQDLPVDWTLAYNLVCLHACICIHETINRFQYTKRSDGSEVQPTQSYTDPAYSKSLLVFLRKPGHIKSDHVINLRQWLSVCLQTEASV